MSDRFNTIAGWTLGAGIVALGLSSISGHYFRAGKEDRPEKMGYAIEGVVQEGGAAADATPFEEYLAKADMAKGEATFKKCAACHTVTQGGAAGIGPNLFGIMGKGVAGGSFAYSDGLKGKGGKWDWNTMSAWLTSPSAFASGTKMSFAGLSDPQERANLIVFLNAQGSKLPLPAVPEKKEGAAAPAAAAVVGDAAKGQKSFAKCAACHSVNAGGANGVGPNLAGVFGAPVGKKAGFAFSDALVGKGGNWDDATLDAWLTAPSTFAPGTKMSFAGLSNPQERADVIAYLKTAK